MLKEQTVQLYQLTQSTALGINVEETIQRLLEENDLIDYRKVPSWILETFDAILNRRPVERTFYKWNSDEGDIWNYLAELEDIIRADWNDSGETVIITFKELGLRACLSLEDNTYEIKRI